MGKIQAGGGYESEQRTFLARWKEYALSIGFGACESGPLVRSSYHADEQSSMFDVRARRQQMLSKQAAAAEPAAQPSFS